MWGSHFVNKVRNDDGSKKMWASVGRVGVSQSHVWNRIQNDKYGHW